MATFSNGEQADLDTQFWRRSDAADAFRLPSNNVTSWFEARDLAVVRFDRPEAPSNRTMSRQIHESRSQDVNDADRRTRGDTPKKQLSAIFREKDTTCYQVQRRVLSERQIPNNSDQTPSNENSDKTSAS